MLTELRIKDFAIIDDLALDLGPGFIVFTGETGAGKSIIIDAVEMILGGRAESVNIRTGSEQAFIEGTFRVDAKVEKEVEAIRSWFLEFEQGDQARRSEHLQNKR
jgi:DNA repair protein RecN (Recombination protein N)